MPRPRGRVCLQIETRVPAVVLNRRTIAGLRERFVRQSLVASRYVLREQ